MSRFPPPSSLNIEHFLHSGPALYRPPKKGLPDQRPKYNTYEQNGATGGNGTPVRYMATGPPGGSMQHQHQDDRSGTTVYHPLPPQLGEQYYAPGQGPKEEQTQAKVQAWSSPVLHCRRSFVRYETYGSQVTLINHATGSRNVLMVPRPALLTTVLYPDWEENNNSLKNYLVLVPEILFRRLARHV